jgi:hypothetical protein
MSWYHLASCLYGLSSALLPYVLLAYLLSKLGGNGAIKMTLPEVCKIWQSIPQVASHLLIKWSAPQLDLFHNPQESLQSADIVPQQSLWIVTMTTLMSSCRRIRQWI